MKKQGQKAGRRKCEKAKWRMKKQTSPEVESAEGRMSFEVLATKEAGGSQKTGLTMETSYINLSASVDTTDLIQSG
jgi:hypothetical protein